MKKIKWVNGNKMLFESGHKQFDRQTNLISTGNIIANTQRGGFIRPRKCTECNGLTRPEGHLREFDLRGWDRMPREIKDKVLELTEDDSVILYRFHHYNNNGWMVTHGWVITTADYNNYKLLYSKVTGPTYKSHYVIEEAIKYVTVDAGA